MTLTEAQREISVKGTPFGEVFEQVEEHNRDVLKKWFVGACAGGKLEDNGLPNLAARESRKPQWLGEMCKCGGMMIQTGSCKTCQSCGTSSGGCG